MIEVLGVVPTVAEMRPAKSASRKARLAAWLTTWTWMAGLILVWGVTGWRSDASSAQAGILALAAAIGIQSAAGKYYAKVVSRAAVSGPAPAACDWRFDEAGLHCRMALSNAFYDWRGISEVRREADRFVFALSPTMNAPLPLRCMTAEQIGELQALIGKVRASGRLGTGVD